MKTILILDTETTGIDPKKDVMIEIGAVLWSVEHRSIVECFSGLLRSASNAAEEVNGITPALLVDAREGASMVHVSAMAGRADAIVAHSVAFDRAFVDQTRGTNDTDWICTIEDFTWPKPSPSKGLTALALAHGCAVVAAHRAINDCLLLARCFESIGDVGERLEAALIHSRLPKAEIHSLAPFDLKDLVKENGFHWDPARKVWHRTMAIADAGKLPFATRVVS
jgi:DNA polymerase-3 subunit epsilon